MALLSRRTLKNFFRRGSFPTEVNFSDLIDSTINKLDDGFAKTPEDGLSLSPQGSSRKLLSFFENLRDKSPAWYFTLSQDKRAKGLSFEDGDGASALFLKKGGAVGIGTIFPAHELDVNGLVGMKGRIGTYKTGIVSADGQWHTILAELDDLQAFEIMAVARGDKGRGKYAILHAIALSAFGKSRGCIRKSSAYYGWFWNRLKMRWVGDVHNYQLQIKTASHYGLDESNKPRKIQFRIAKLWDNPDELINPVVSGPVYNEEEIDL